MSKKKSRRIAISRVALILCCLAVGLYLSRDLTPPTSPDFTTINSNIHGDSQLLLLEQTNVAVLAEAKSNNVRLPIDPDTFFNSQNVSIRFWGKVVDQDEKPLGGAKIRLRVRQWRLVNVGKTRGDFKTFARTSGLDGRFHLDGEKGDVLTVESILKEGYELSPKAQKSFGYNISTNITPDPERPVVFRMWHVQPAEPLVVGQKFARIVPDGRAYSINLSANTITHGETKSADLLLRLKRPVNVSRGDRFDWSLRIEAMQASLIQTNAEFMYVAPASGYTSNYLFEARSDTQEWARRIKRSFFLKTEGGNFARMDVDAFGFYDGEAAVEISFALNPSGSTNLRFDRTAQPVQKQFE